MSVIKVWNMDGSSQSVCLYAQVRCDEVLKAIASRQKIAAERVALYSLYLIITWQVQERFADPRIEFRVEKLAPDSKPLRVKTLVEQADGMDSDTKNADGTVLRRRKHISTRFVFCDSENEKLLREHGEGILAAQTKASSHHEMEGKRRKEFGLFPPVNMVGDRSGYLLKRSSVNNREWQKQWCVLRRDELVHCQSKAGIGGPDSSSIPLTHNSVSMSTGSNLKYCFEIHTAHSVEYFRAKGPKEAKEWVAAIQTNIELTGENELFRLAEYMIADEEVAMSTREEEVVLNAYASLEGLLASLAGANTLLKYARIEQFKGKQQTFADQLYLEARASIVLYVEIQRALEAFKLAAASNATEISTNPSKGGGNDGVSSVRKRPSLSFFESEVSGRLRQSSQSVVSAASSASTTSLRLSTPPPSRKEWMFQLCEKYLNLEYANQRESDEHDLYKRVEAIRSRLQRALVNQRPFGSNQSPSETGLSETPSNTASYDTDMESEFAATLERMKEVVGSYLRRGLYSRFVASEHYVRLVASIPTKITN